jgi:uncharacterized protein (TIGR02145 family)
MKSQITLISKALFALIYLLFASCNEDEIGTNAIVKDIDGNIYHTVTIGTQTWMVENLKTTKFRDGSSIPNVTDNNDWTNYGAMNMGAYCDYNNTVSYSNTYGRLYNWYAVTNERNICPPGWHVPSSAEWETLISYLGGQTLAGGAMKEKGTTHCSGPNIGGTNRSGFTALPGGCRQIDSGMYYGNGVSCAWWSSSQINEQTAWYCQLYYDQTSINKMAFDKTSGCSIRLIKD